MATVYLAHNQAAGRFAAVKLVHPHLAADPSFAEMFVDEAEIASRIRHPNVCGVYDFEVSGSRSYIAMEYLLGEPIGAVWRKLRRAEGLDPKRRAQLVAKVLADACEGLHAAHELTDDEGEPLEVVHRDVSPGNIVLTFDGVAKMVDFGVATAARKRHRTETGMLKGKLAYIAPESLRGTKADRRCDVWGIGVVAWELVTGERLFRSDRDVDTLRAVTDKPIPRPSEVRPGLPDELDDVIMLALQRDPDDRYETARDLGRDLARIASGNDVITAGDLGEWLGELFPGAKERRLQLLDIAGQIASGEDIADPEREPTPETVIAPPPLRPPAEQERTRLYDRESVAPPRAPWRRLWPLVLGVIVGVVAGGGTAWILQHQQPPPSTPPVAAPAPDPPADPRPELRIRPGTGFARGPYVIELVDSTPEELLLRIRLEHAEADEPVDAPTPR